MVFHNKLLWTARISGVLITFFFLGFFVGEGIPDILNGKGKELLEFLPFAAITLAGFIAAWRKPVPGGILLIIGSLLLAGFFWLTGDTRMIFVYGLPAFLVGCCFLAAAGKSLT
jgi:hypothetical protein